MRYALETGSTRFEWAHLTGRGKELPCEVSLIRFQRRGRPALAACVRDLRAAKRQEAILARERAILRSIFDNIRGLVFLRDAQGRYLAVNKQFSAVSGMSPEQITGKTDAEIWSSEVAELHRVSDLAARTASPHSFERTLTLPDGTRRDYLISKEALYATDGEFDGMLGLGIDVTRLKEAERQIARAKALAEESDRAKSDFLARVSHELRTPMNAISGLAFLCLQTDLDPAQRDSLEKIKGAADHLMELLATVLDFSTMESGGAGIEEAPFALDAVLNQLETLFGEKARRAGIAFSIARDDDVPAVLTGDPARLGQILINLVSNALKFTRRGSVRVRVALDKAFDERVSLHFSVADTGMGMTEAQMRHLFEPFSRADGSADRLYGGTGLGLAICKSLVELMEGTIRAESSPGRGSVFHFTAGFGRVDSVRRSAPEAPPEDWRLSGCSALLAEDNRINQEIAVELLRLCGVETDVAVDGEEAVRAALARRYDVIFMDIQMPVLDGLAACRRIRGSGAPWAADVPIVALTANAMAGDRKKSLHAGMDAHLAKPVDIESLRRVLYLLLGPGSDRSRRGTDGAEIG